MRWVTLRVVLQRNVMLCLSSLHIKALFYRDVTDDANCDLSDRAKEPDEVGPETEPGALVTLAPSK
ncbi:hypothetical protein ACA40_23180 [Pseudomonas syringae pv. lapsa]|nr:hypothetical protein ACA40_23180 [Pseudomonas syringae pv. lapsa]KTC01580.1 hypothetical protein AO387_06235 [Pseudomonas syringae ICMP 11168]PHN43080.1 hypothetical protein AO254_18220 [Pseudomonas syringae]POD29167.1 hypothetical protein BKM14_22875 [Pseudomonas syringae pv. syringae]POD46151.1 hypothetical protein BKM15_26080 [Pseudomonas syringae pv. syringae]